VTWLEKHALSAALAFFLAMGALTVAIGAWVPPQANLCGSLCDPAYLQYPGSPYASPCLVVNEGPVPSQWRGIKLCFEGPRGNG
jgi:hypothetical protein